MTAPRRWRGRQVAALALAQLSPSVALGTVPGDPTQRADELLADGGAPSVERPGEGASAATTTEAQRQARWVRASAGLHYAVFSREWEELRTEIGSISTGLYALKTAEVEFLDLWGFEGSLGYAATRFLRGAGFQSPTQVAAPSDDAMRLLGTLLMPFSDALRVRAEAQYGVFDTSAGLSDYAVVTHLGRDGGAHLLAPGEQVAYSTRFAVGSLEASVGTWGSIDHEVFLGYTLFETASSEWLRFSQTGTQFSALADTDRTCNAVSLRMVPLAREVAPGLSWYVKPFYYLGLGTASSPWFSATGVCSGQGGELGVRYVGRGYGLVIGYSFYDLSFLLGDEVTLDHDLTFIGLGGEARRAPAGSVWDTGLESRVRYMGPFLQLSLGI